MPGDEKGFTNGWNEWSRHVLLELERLDEDIKELQRCVGKNKDDTSSKISECHKALMDRLDSLRTDNEKRFGDMRTDLVTLKVKVALIGGFAGLVASGLVTLLIRLLAK